MTKEQERLKFEKKLDLTRAYGLVKGILGVIKSCDGHDKAGLILVLEEVEEILKKQAGVK